MNRISANGMKIKYFIAVKFVEFVCNIFFFLQSPIHEAGLWSNTQEEIRENSKKIGSTINIV